MKVTLTIRINDTCINTCKKLMKNKFFITGILVILISTVVIVPIMGTSDREIVTSKIAVQYTSMPGDTITADKINQNFTTLKTTLETIKNTYIPKIKTNLVYAKSNIDDFVSVIGGEIKRYEVGLIPPGMIVMYYGTTADGPPPGYVFCDGQNGTPDLRDKFIIGAEVDTNVDPNKFYVGRTYDETTEKHTHRAPHRHDFNTIQGGEHKHKWLQYDSGTWKTYNPTYSGISMFDNNNFNSPGSDQFKYSFTLSGGTPPFETSTHTGHTHAVSMQSNENANTSDAIPAHYALYYVMKKLE